MSASLGSDELNASLCSTPFITLISPYMITPNGEFTIFGKFTITQKTQNTDNEYHKKRPNYSIPIPLRLTNYNPATPETLYASQYHFI
jgi:hypothetical protein